MLKKRSSRRRRKKIIRNFLAFIFILGLAFIGYSVVSNMEKKDSPQITSDHKDYSIYSELENNDTARYLHKIEMNDNIDILHLSEMFYKKDAFWPYIIEANSEIENPLFITKGSIVKIPRISSELLDTNNTQSMRNVKLLGDSILNVNLEKQKTE